MADQRRESYAAWATAALFIVLGATVRAWPLLRGHGLQTGIDMYDDGVYVAAASLFVRGVMPYRDFVLVHPPGLTLFLSPVAWLEPVSAYLAARWLFVAVGTLNLLLAGWAARRWLGAWPAVAAIAVYALLPEVTQYERAALLEPLLNTGAFTVFIIGVGAPARWRPIALGIAVGLMCSVKLTGVLWAAPAGLFAFRHDGKRGVGSAVAAALIIGLAIALPFAWPSPSRFVEQLVIFHLRRPPDGVLAATQRAHILWMRGWALYVFCALAALAVRLRKPGTERERALFTPLALAATLLFGFLLSAKTFWVEYSVALGPVQALGVALALAWVSRITTPRALRVAVLLLAVGAAFVRVAMVRGAMLRAGTEVERTAEYLRGVSSPDCVSAMEPAWLLAANRLPAGARPVVDSYGDLLLTGISGGAPLGRIEETFASPVVTQRFREMVTQCPHVVWGWRGDFQSTEDTRRWFAERAHRVFPLNDQPGISVFRLGPVEP